MQNEPAKRSSVLAAVLILSLLVASSGSARIDYLVDGYVLDLVLGDFNGDGTLDIAAAIPSATVITVLINAGDSSFTAGVNYPSGGSCNSIVAADFDGDSILDLAVTNGDEASIGLLIGNGDGTFQSPLTFPTPSDPRALEIGDFNGNGFDLAFLTGEMNSASVVVFLNDGFGSFTGGGLIATDSNPTHLVAGNFNGDAHTDLVVSHHAVLGFFPEHSIWILDGNGDGSFQAPSYFDVPFNEAAIIYTDVNWDKTADLIVAVDDDDVCLGRIRALENDGQGEFSSAFYTDWVWDCPVYLLGVDFDGDSLIDIGSAASTYYIGSDEIQIHLNRGTSLTYGPMLLYSEGWVTSMTSGDLDGDGDPDIVAANWIFVPDQTSGSSGMPGDRSESYYSISVIDNYDNGGLCCEGQRGDVDTSGGTDVADVSYIVDYLFGPIPSLPCEGEADVNGSLDVNISDLTFLVDYLFNGGPEPRRCLIFADWPE